MGAGEDAAITTDVGSNGLTVMAAATEAFQWPAMREGKAINVIADRSRKSQRGSKEALMNQGRVTSGTSILIINF